MPSDPLHVILLGPHEASDRTHSLSRITNLVYDQLSEQGIAVEIQHFAEHKGNKLRQLLEKMLFFPLRLKRRLDQLQRRAPQTKIVFHATDESFAYYSWLLRRHRFIWSCNDIFQVHRYTDPASGRINNWFYRRLYRGISYADRIACISDETRRDLLQRTGLPDDRVTTVHLSLNYSYTPMPTAEAIPRLNRLLSSHGAAFAYNPFFMHVGANYPRKNRLGLLRIFRHLKEMPSFANHFLLTVGKLPDDAFRSYAQKHGLDQWVASLTNIENEDLRALYSTATALIFPSLQEGYGWPIVEAQACGCPVFATGRPPMNEIGGEAAVYFDPSNEKEAAETIARQLPTLDGIGKAGIANAARFSPQAMTRAYIQLYRALLLAPI